MRGLIWNLQSAARNLQSAAHVGQGLDTTAIGHGLDKTAIGHGLDKTAIGHGLDTAAVRPAFAENGLAPASYGSLRNPITGVPRARKLKLFSTMARRNLIAGAES